MKVEGTRAQQVWNCYDSSVFGFHIFSFRVKSSDDIC